MPKETAQKPELITIDEVTRRLAESMTKGDIDRVRQEVISQIFDGKKLPLKPVFALKFPEPHYAFLEHYRSGRKAPEIRHSICLRVIRELDKEAIRLAKVKPKTPEEARKFMKTVEEFEITTIKLKPSTVQDQTDQE